MDASNKKRSAAKAAMEFIKPGMTVGIGTGSTVNFLIEMLPEIRKKINRIVSSSKASTSLLEMHGFTVSNLNEVGEYDIYIDGADESNNKLQLIKGGGGALTREKILACAAHKFICIIDDTKLVETLGNFPLPIEILPMAKGIISRYILKMNGQPVWREGFITDNGNHIVDIHGLQISNPLEMEASINSIPGVVTVGIFANQAADILLVGDDNGVKEIRN